MFFQNLFDFILIIVIILVIVIMLNAKFNHRYKFFVINVEIFVVFKNVISNIELIQIKYESKYVITYYLN